MQDGGGDVDSTVIGGDIKALLQGIGRLLEYIDQDGVVEVHGWSKLVCV